MIGVRHREITMGTVAPEIVVQSLIDLVRHERGRTGDLTLGGRIFVCPVCVGGSRGMNLACDKLALLVDGYACPNCSQPQIGVGEPYDPNTHPDHCTCEKPRHRKKRRPR